MVIKSLRMKTRSYISAHPRARARPPFAFAQPLPRANQTARTTDLFRTQTALRRSQ